MLMILLLLTAVSLAFSLLFTPTIRILAVRWNLVDLPDNKRKVHKTPIPRVGGVAIAAAYFGSLLAVAAFLAYHRSVAATGFAAVKSIVPAALVIFLIGLADDIFNLKAWHKFVVQIVAAGMVVTAGVHIHGVAEFSIHPLVGTVATIVWLVACTNAINLIDGLDGLAAGISLLATLTILVASLISGNIGLAVATVPLAGALLGFLAFNFNPASIFLGDSGSLLLGFLLGCYSVLWSGTATTPLEMGAPLIALAVPLADTTLAIARRFLRGQPIFTADRAHIHHRLLARGLSHRKTVLLLYAAASVAGLLALCLIGVRDHWEGLVLGIFACAAMLAIRKLGYDEFAALGRVIFRGGLRREIKMELAVQTFEESLRGAENSDACWTAVQGGCKEFGFHPIRMQLAGRVFHSQSNRGSLRSWSMRVPVSENDWIELTYDSDAVSYPVVTVLFANAMRRVLADKNIHGTEFKEKAAFSAARYQTQQSPAA